MAWQAAVRGQDRRATLAHCRVIGLRRMSRCGWCKPLDGRSYNGFGMAAMQRIMGGAVDGLAQGLPMRVPLGGCLLQAAYALMQQYSPIPLHPCTHAPSF